MGGALLLIAVNILLRDERPVVGVRFLVCGDMGWQIWMRINTDIFVLDC